MIKVSGVKMKQVKKQQSGFTLTEILIALAIVAIMGTVVTLSLLGNTDRAMVTKLKSDIGTIQQALEQYSLDNGFYPTTDQGLQALINRPNGEPVPTQYSRGGYLGSKSIPKDPWKQQYLYISPGANGDYDLFTFGKDRRQGGEGENKDIGNWNIDQVNFNAQNENQ